MKLAGKVTLVTGGGRGIGEAICVAYYLEAALARPGGASSRDLEEWFWGDTNAGRVFLALQRACAASDDPFIATLGRQLIVPRAQAHRIR